MATEEFLNNFDRFECLEELNNDSYGTNKSQFKFKLSILSYQKEDLISFSWQPLSIDSLSDYAYVFSFLSVHM